MTDYKKIKQNLDQDVNSISYHIREIKHENTYEFIVEKQTDFYCQKLSSNYFYALFFANIIPVAGWLSSYALRHNFDKAIDHYECVDGCTDIATAASIAAVAAYKLLDAYNSPLIVLQKLAYVSVPLLLISSGYYFFSKENDSLQTNSNCGKERQKILKEIGCPAGWSKDISFPGAQITLACTPPKALTNESLLRDICDGNKFIKNLKMQGIATLESEIEYGIALHPNINSDMDCSTGIVTERNIHVADEL